MHIVGTGEIFSLHNPNDSDMLMDSHPSIALRGRDILILTGALSAIDEYATQSYLMILLDERDMPIRH